MDSWSGVISAARITIVGPDARAVEAAAAFDPPQRAAGQGLLLAASASPVDASATRARKPDRRFAKVAGILGERGAADREEGSRPRWCRGEGPLRLTVVRTSDLELSLRRFW